MDGLKGVNLWLVGMIRCLVPPERNVCGKGYKLDIMLLVQMFSPDI